LRRCLFNRRRALRILSRIKFVLFSKSQHSAVVAK
jgi:hypothetical protein